MTIIAFVLGSVACLSSLVLLVICIEAKDTDFVARLVSPQLRPVNSYVNPTGGDPTDDTTFVGDCSHTLLRYVSWGELQTILYLKISLSDFLTVFAARCRYW